MRKVEALRALAREVEAGRLPLEELYRALDEPRG